MKRMRKLQYTGGMTRFVLTEKEVLRKVSHRFIQGLHYAFQTYEHLYLVFDFCPGGDMRSIINMCAYTALDHSRTSINSLTEEQEQEDKERICIPEREARLYLAEIVVSIEELHRNGIVHRDIKPENILLDAEGHIKLSDFGLAKEGMFGMKMTHTLLGGG